MQCYARGPECRCVYVCPSVGADISLAVGPVLYDVMHGAPCMHVHESGRPADRGVRVMNIVME